MRLLVLLVLLGCARPESRLLAPDVEASCQAAELRRQPSAEMRALLSSPSGAVRMRAALAVGRIGDAQAPAPLEKLLADAEAGETAAWALGRIEGGQGALVRCVVSAACPSAAAAARALSGPAAGKTLQIEPLLAALRGPAAEEAAISLGVLARNKDAKFPPQTWAALASALPRGGAAYALSRIPRGDAPGLRESLAAALRDPNPWTRSLAARAWGKQGLPADGLAEAFADPDWRVRVEAARGLATADGAAALFARVVAQQSSPHVLVALFEAAAQIGEAVLPAIPLTSPDPVIRCAAAQARDRIRKQLIDTPGCGDAGPARDGSAQPRGWRDRARTGALAAELGLLAPAREALRDPDARVRGATAGAAGPELAADVLALLGDPDPYVVQDAAGTLAKPSTTNSVQNSQTTQGATQGAPGVSGNFVQNSLNPLRATAVAAVRRLGAAHEKPAGDPRSDALTALVELTGPLPELLPTPNVVLAAALKQPPQPVPVPVEARAMPAARRLRIRTSRGEMLIDLRPDVAPLTSSALAALAGRRFYDGLTFHRVVPDFVVQGGDPRGDGDGGPGWAIPDEHSPLRFLRGTLGIATNGPETGGSQFFLCHSPQPHLDGRYTIAGQLRAGDDVLDALQPGDTILAATAE